MIRLPRAPGHLFMHLVWKYKRADILLWIFPLYSRSTMRACVCF